MAGRVGMGWLWLGMMARDAHRPAVQPHLIEWCIPALAAVLQRAPSCWSAAARWLMLSSRTCRRALLLPARSLVRRAPAPATAAHAAACTVAGLTIQSQLQ